MTKSGPSVEEIAERPTIAATWNNASAATKPVANNYRALRKLGFTVKKTIDTLIATRCIEDDLQLLHNDSDFDSFEKHLGLRVLH